MIVRILVVLLAVPALGLGAERFVLVENGSGAATAPIAFSNGAQVAIGAQVYTLKLAEDRMTQTEARMRDIVIPSVEFREAAIPDVIRFLAASSEGGAAAPRLNLVLEDEAPRSPPEIRKISLQLSRVSLYDTLRIVCERSGMDFRIDAAGIIHVAPKAAE